jgi:diadenosine tetraphosphate (Ap4A) HIT family hydrolase
MNYDTNNVFARIIRGEIPADKVYEDDSVLAFHDIAGEAPVHVLVIPKGEFISFADFANKASPQTIGDFFSTVGKIAASLNLENGFRIISNTGADASQSVFHFHVHILGGKNLGRLLSS